MTTSLDSLTPSSSPERREQTAAFLEQFWKGGEAVGKYGAAWYELAHAAWLACCDWKDAWRVVATDPPPVDQEILAYFVNEYGKWRIVRATVSGLHTLEINPECEAQRCTCGACDGEYVAAGGWYETNEFEDIHWEINCAVTHWRPLPEPPR